MRLRVLCILLLTAGLPIRLGAQAGAQDAGNGVLRDTVDASAPDDLGAVPPPPPPIALPPPIPDNPPVRKKKKAANPEAVLGLGAGPLRLFTEVESGVVVSTNAAQTKKKHPDVGLRVAPTLRLQSDWSRHELKIDAHGDFTRSLDTGDLTGITGGIRGDARIDVRHDTQANLAAAYDISQAPLGQSDQPTDAAERRTDHDSLAQVSIRHDLGQFAAEAGLGVQRYVASNVKLQNGTTEDNGDRAYTEPELRLRGELTGGAVWRPFIEARYQPRFFDQKRDRNGIRRDSNNYTALAGLAFDDGAIWQGSIAATYLLRDYRAAGLDSAHVFGFDASVAWRPTELTTVNFRSGAGLDESFTKGADSVRVWTANIDIAHALTDNVEISGGAGLNVEDGNSTTDFTYMARLGARWQLNPFFALSGAVESTWFDAENSADSYDEQRATVSMVLRR